MDTWVRIDKILSGCKRVAWDLESWADRGQLANFLVSRFVEEVLAGCTERGILSVNIKYKVTKISMDPKDGYAEELAKSVPAQHL